MTEPVVIGIDGGGTKTMAAVALADGTIIGQAKSGPSNYQVVGIERAVKEIVAGAVGAVDDASVQLTAVKAVWAGLAGVNTRRDTELLYKSLRSCFAGFLAVDNDAYNCLACETDGYGVAVIAGTGSIAVGVNNDGKRARAGGWGYILGDEGSGYDVGRKALQAVCQQLDGRGPKTILVDLLFEHLGGVSGDDLYSLVYDDGGLKRHQIAGLAVLVSAASDMGDPVSSELLAAAGDELGCLAVAVIERLGLVNYSTPVALCGGMFADQQLVVSRLAATIQRSAPEADVVCVREDPVQGAVRMAVKLYAGCLKGA